MLQKYKKILTLTMLLITAFVLSGCPGSPIARQWEAERKQRDYMQNPPNYLVPGYSVSGNVGHHMNQGARAGCSGKWSYGSASRVSGSLPPGLTLQGDDVVGTPRSPGTWVVQVKFTGLKCVASSGKSRTYPDRVVNARITIKGIAARRVR